MPQMAPMLWFYLFVYFILVYIIYIVLVYFNFNPTLSLGGSASSTSKRASKSWLW